MVSIDGTYGRLQVPGARTLRLVSMYIHTYLYNASRFSALVVALETYRRAVSSHNALSNVQVQRLVIWLFTGILHVLPRPWTSPGWDPVIQIYAIGVSCPEGTCMLRQGDPYLFLPTKPTPRF